jgi:hypothetical protein
MEQEFYNRHFSDTIALPGTTSEAKKGGRREKREIGYLTEPYHFEGYAWYGREVEVKDYQPGDQVILKLERTRKSYVWIDGVFVGSRESFCTSHIYDLTAYLMQGRGHLSVMISNVCYKIPVPCLFCPRQGKIPTFRSNLFLISFSLLLHSTF